MIMNSLNTNDTKQTPHFIVVFIGDSLSMARYFVGVQLEDTYSYLLEMFWRELYPAAYAWSLMIPGIPLQQVSATFHDRFILRIGSRKIDACVVHCGIVDCAPRVLPGLMQHGLNLLPPALQNVVVRFLHRNRPRLQKAGWSFRLTPPDKFDKIYSNLLQSLSSQSSRVYVINITPGIESLYEHSPGLRESIVKYNEIISRIASKFDNVKLIDVLDEFQRCPERYLTDDLHIMKDSHYYIYSHIRRLELKALEKVGVGANEEEIKFNRD